MVNPVDLNHIFWVQLNLGDYATLHLSRYPAHITRLYVSGTDKGMW